VPWPCCRSPNPAARAAPHQHRLAVGIDLGTTNSLVATVRSGRPAVLPTKPGAPLLPSVVHYGEDGAGGRPGLARALRGRADPRNTVASAKR
jgi:molecular chaperone HscA